MNNTKTIFMVTLAALAAVCASLPVQNIMAQEESNEATEEDWTTLSGTFDPWRQVGDANWRLEDGVFIADSGSGHLVTRESYEDFRITLEFWAAEESNSGVFLRLSDPDQIMDSNAYEVNIYDTRPDQTYRTGSIVNFTPPSVTIDSEGRWNSYDITVEGNSLKVKLNGVTTAVLEDDTYESGPISLQYGAGELRFRNIRIMEL